MMKAVSLFSGAGGMDVGVLQSGFDVLASVEVDPHCCNTLRASIEKEGRKTQVFEQDIRTLLPQELMQKIKIKQGDLDLLFGGPPCQSFSLAGKQLGLDDARGMLLFEMIRLAKELKPKVVLLEQVKGLLSAKGVNNIKGEVFQLFLNELSSIGYIPKWKVLLAADFGVPQLRERLFVVATRKVNGFVFPDPTHAADVPNFDFFGLKKHTTVGDAIANLGTPIKKIKNDSSQILKGSHIDVTPARDVERITVVPEGGHLAAQMHIGKELRGNLTKKDTTKYLRLNTKKPSNTLRCGEIFFHPTENRYLTPKEYMKIHGYPDSYELFGPIRARSGTVKNLDQHRQVANSVPPPVAKALANQIRNYIYEQNF